MSVSFRTAKLFAVVFFALALAVPAFSDTVEVGTCIPNLVHFSTIQDAVNHSAQGGGTTIDVCPGTYPEQVTISNNLSLRGVADPNSNQDAAVVVVPQGGVVANTTSLSSGAPIAAQILVVSPATQVSISSLTVDGSGNNLPDCSVDLIGIYYRNASGSVNTSAVRNQVLAPGLTGCQSGLGIFAQSGQSGSSTLTVQQTSVHNYQKNGITGDEAGTTLNAIGNVVQGSGSANNPPGAAQNGIQIGFGAKGRVTGNTIIDQVYGDITQAISIGVLLYDAAENSGITVNTNNIHDTQGGVGIYTDDSDPSQYGDGVTVQANNIFETLNYDAIDVCTNSNIIRANIIANSAESGIHLDSSCSSGGNNTGNSNTVNNNVMLESDCAGILEDSGTTNSIGSGGTANIFVDIPSTLTNSTCSSVPQGKKPVKATRFRPVR